MQDKIVSFFITNNSIKRCIDDNQPNGQDTYNSDDLMQYSNGLSDTLNQIEYLFLKIDRDFELSMHDYIINLFDSYQDKLMDSSNDYFKIQNMYGEIFSNNDETYTEEVNTNFFGYSIANKIDILKHAKTINELLNGIKSFIINNEKIYQSLPLISSKEIDNKEEVKLYNSDADLGKTIFDSFPGYLNVGETSILNIDNNHVLIMVRDVGHALIIEVERDNDKCYIKYFIPKVCNYLMVNQLPGVKLTKNDSIYARGHFTVNTQSVLYSLYNLIQNVPTDNDMYKLGGKFYQVTSLNR